MNKQLNLRIARQHRKSRRLQAKRMSPERIRELIWGSGFRPTSDQASGSAVLEGLQKHFPEFLQELNRSWP